MLSVLLHLCRLQNGARAGTQDADGQNPLHKASAQLRVLQDSAACPMCICVQEWSAPMIKSYFGLDPTVGA